MMTPQDRRELAMRAVQSVLAGGMAKDFETQVVDFKEEDGSRDKEARIKQIGPRHEEAARKLAEAAACMANTDDGGVLVVGVDDKLSGSTALSGAQSDAGWLRERILALTQPGLNVEIEEVSECGKRLLLVNIPPAIREINVNGKLQTRYGTSCRELSGEDALNFLQGRRNFDWSAQGSGMTLSQADADALAVARRLYKDARGLAPESDRELVSRLGVLRDETADPELTRAGALLLCEYEPGVEQMHLMIRDVEKSTSRINERGSAPILPLLEKILRLLLTEAFPPDSQLVGFQMRELRPIPELVIRESIVNAVMHRDYRLPMSVVVASATGAPCDALKITSPGGLLPEVPLKNIISTSSTPRNRNLSQAIRTLGLAEGEGTGISRMFREMLKEGHESPEIVEQSGSLIMRLVGGAPDTKILEFFSELGLKNPNLMDDLLAILTIKHLLSKPVVRGGDLVEVTQYLPGDAKAALERLEATSAIERLLNGSLSFRLSQSSKDLLGDRILYQTRSTQEDHADLILSFLDSKEDIGREEAMKLLGLSSTQTSVTLRGMLERGQIALVGAKAGPRVRYKKSLPH